MSPPRSNTRVERSLDERVEYLERQVARLEKRLTEYSICDRCGERVLEIENKMHRMLHEAYDDIS